MFFVHGKTRNLMKSGNQKMSTPLKVSMILVALSLAAAGMVFDLKVKPKKSSFTQKPTKIQADALLALKMVECLYLGIAASFVIFGGITVSKVAAKMRPKMLVIYLCITFLMCSWWPHIHFHQFFKDTWALIAIDFSFHVTTALVSCALTVFIVRLMQVATGTKVKKIEGWTVKQVFASDLVQMATITIVIASIAFGLGQMIPYGGVKKTPVQKGILQFLFFFESCLLGTSFAVVYKMIPLIRKMQTRSLKIKSIWLCGCIWWTLASWFPHLRLHGQTNDKGLISVDLFLTIDGVFHLSVMIVSSMLAFVVFGLIRLAVNLSTSPFNNADSTHMSSKSRKSGVAASKVIPVSQLVLEVVDDGDSSAEAPSAEGSLEAPSQETPVVESQSATEPPSV